MKNVLIFASCSYMPALAFIKCWKVQTGFYSCKRCVVKGEPINRTRVFKDFNLKQEPTILLEKS